MHRLFKYLMVVIIAFLLLVTTGCGEQSSPPSNPEEDQAPENREATANNEGQDLYSQSIVISGLPSGEITVTVGEIMEMPAESNEAMSISSSGEETVTTYKGVLLDKILERHDAGSVDYTALRLLALDGYSIEVPPEILESSPVILAYELDGKLLEGKDQPLRVVIPDVRSMYWAKGLSQIELISDEGKSSINKIFILEDLLGGLQVTDDMNVDVAELLGLEEESRITIMAADGLIKTETLAVDEHQYFIQLAGEDSPLFYSPELPRTMYVKQVAVIMHGDRAFLFGTAYEEKEVSGQVFYDMLKEYLPDGEIVINPGMSSEQTIDKEDLTQLKLTGTVEPATF
ncbi:MAG: molybdopterin-dependent oxidoreductase [Bacillota bacterium]|nr:molybdopterin-dependent oxidoreductase [Bacillota bacterium]